MGSCLSQEPDIDFSEPVDFDHFHILRAIGKGAFGKVCIVKKKDTKQMYAMKYMNKVQIIKKHAVENVFREITILRSLDHKFLVNLWFTFQDREDIFIVLDLMLGGDISYHLEKAGKFSLSRVKLYIAEISLALEYLRSKNIIHRDIKPANMLLDTQGHVHLTDFNVATIVKPNSTVMSITGTKPYMAPEVVQAPSTGYNYAVDWWSLGVSAYEMLRGHRPFTIEKNMTNAAMYNMLRHTRPSASASWDQNTCDVLKMLLHPDGSKRLRSANSMRKHSFFENLNWEDIGEKKATPPFVPPQNRINCDPTHELEEMIVEPNPLHKKRHRLSKRSFRTEEDAVEVELDKIQRQFKVYNRIRENEPTEASPGPAAPPIIHKPLQHEGESSSQRLITPPVEEEEEEATNPEIEEVAKVQEVEVTIENQEVTIENQEVTIENQEVTIENQEVTIENQEVTIENQENQEVTIENQEVITERQEVNELSNGEAEGGDTSPPRALTKVAMETGQEIAVLELDHQPYRPATTPPPLDHHATPPPPSEGTTGML